GRVQEGSKGSGAWALKTPSGAPKFPEFRAFAKSRGGVGLPGASPLWGGCATMPMREVVRDSHCHRLRVGPEKAGPLAFQGRVSGIGQRPGRPHVFCSAAQTAGQVLAVWSSPIGVGVESHAATSASRKR